MESIVVLSKESLDWSMNNEDVFFWDKENLPENKKNVSLLSKIDYGSRIKDQHLINYMTEYFDLFGHKDSCFSYLQPYLQLGLTFSSVIESKLKFLLDKKLGSEDSLQLLLTAFKLNEYFLQSLITPAMPISYKEYIHYYILSKSICHKPLCDFIILALFSIFREYAEEQTLPIKVSIPEQVPLSLPYPFLFTAVSLALVGIQDDDSNFTLKLIAIFLLRELGAVSLAISLYASLNIKFIQLDILSYIVFDWVPLVGFKDEIIRIQKGLSSLYHNNDRETPGLIIEAFKYGSYSQVPEFVDLHQQLKYSIQRKISEITTIQSDCLQLGSKSSIDQYFLNLRLPLIHKAIVDNRPFIDLFPTWNTFTSFTGLLKRFTPKDTSWIETCYAILLAMKSCIVPFSSLDELIIFPTSQYDTDELIVSSQLCSLLKVFCELVNRLGVDYRRPKFRSSYFCLIEYC